MNERILTVVGNQPITMTQAMQIKKMYEVECSAEYIADNYNVSKPTAREIALALRDYQQKTDGVVSEKEALYNVVIKDNLFGNGIARNFKGLEKEVAV